MSGRSQSWPAEFSYLVRERAYLLQGVERYQEALALFEGLLELDPDDMYCRDAVSALFLATGNPEEAIRHASIAISAEATSAVSFMRRCEGYLRLGRFTEAEQDLRALEDLHATSFAARMRMRFRAVRRSHVPYSSRKTNSFVQETT